MMRCSATGMMTRLEGERDGGGDVEMIGVLHIGLPGDRQRKHDGLQREDVEQRIKTVLIEQHEADQHQAAGEKMRDVEGETLHFRVLETNSSSAPRKPSISAAPTKSGTRKTRILAMLVSNTPSATPASGELGEIGKRAEQPVRDAGVGDRKTPRRKNADDERDVENELQHRGELDHRQMPAGIFEDHRLMHHGQFEVGRGIVDRNAPVLGDRDDDERDQRHAERDAQAHVARDHIGRDRRQLRRARDQRQSEDDHDHRRLGQRAEQRLAARAEAAEAGSDVEPRQREKKPRRAQERNDRDEIGRP